MKLPKFINPIPNSYLTSPFGERPDPFGSGKKVWHQGVDLARQPNTNVEVLAAADGEVIRVGELGTYGNIVMIRHMDGKTLYETNYAHLKNNSTKVKVGQKVKQGQVIGIMGSSGSSTAPHLHFEIHLGKWVSGQKNAIDPEKFIKLHSKGEMLTMSQYNELKKLIEAQATEIKSLKADLGKKLDSPSTSSTPSSWAKDGWEWAKKTKDKKGVALVDGSNAQGFITREQMVTILNRYDNK